MIPTSSLRDLSPWFASIHFGACRVSLLTFYINDFGAIMVLHILSQTNFRSFHFQLHHPRCLADSSCMVKAVQQHKDYQQQFQKKEMCTY